MLYRKEFHLLPEELIIYLRKSRSDDPYLSVEEVLKRHEEILREWQEQNLEGMIPETNVYREVVSGETIKDRPEFNKVLVAQQSPKIKGILIVEPQRLSRGDLEDIGRLMKLIKYSNTLVITPQRIYDLHDEYDFDSLERELKRGNEYLEYSKKILNRGRLLSVSQGNYLGTIPPYGYDKTTVQDGKRKCPTLKENKEQADVVRMIFDMYVNKDMGRTSICNRLDELEIKPPKGKYWSPPALKDMLENIHYIGKVKWNWRKTVTVVEDSEIVQTRPKAKIGEYLVYEGKHDGIISEELFNAARAKQGRNHRAKAKTKVRNPLAGLVFCKCGKAMSYRTYKDAAPRLLCDAQTKCGTASCLYSEMLDRVCEVLKECILDFEIRLENNEGDSVKLHNSLIKQLETRQEELNQREINLWEEKSERRGTADEMPEAIFQKLKEKIRVEKEEIQQALCKAYESMPEAVDYEDKIVKFTEALEALKNDNVDAAKKNQLMKAVIERIDYSRGQNVRITKKNAAQYGIEVLNTGSNWFSPPFEIDVKLKM